MGGRPGYPDERHHGRFAGRSSGGYRGGGQSHLYFTLMEYLLSVGVLNV